MANYGMNKMISLLEDIQNCFNLQLYEEVEKSCSSEYILTFLYQKNKEKLLFDKCNVWADRKFFDDINLKLSECDIAGAHPLLGVAYDKSAYSQAPLYRHLNPTEPQLTKALSVFLSENQQSCKAFVQAIFELLKEDIDSNGQINDYRCLCEVVTNDVKDAKKRRKRIDNAIIWDGGALCIEVKFDAIIKDNDLSIYKDQMKKTYQKQMKKCAPDGSIKYVAISIDNIQYEIDKKGCSYWKNLLWADVLRTWEKILANYNSDEDMDLKRYRSSLWRKVLHKGENDNVD